HGDAYGFIVAPDGKVILASTHADKLTAEKNLFDVFTKADLPNFSLAELQTAMIGGASNSFTLSYNGQRRLASFAPTGINNWYTFSVSSDALMLEQEQATQQMVGQLLLKLAAISLSLLIWIILWNWRHNKAMLAASQKYQALLTNIDGGMVIANHATSLEAVVATEVSPGFTAMTGYTLKSLQELYHGRYFNLILEEERAAVFADYLKQVALGNTYRLSYRLHKKDGSLLWVMDSGYIMRDINGAHNHCLITDIASIKEQEDALRRSEERFSLAINASSGSLFEIDLQKQLCAHFDNAERIFGVPAEKLLAATKAFSSLPYATFVSALINYFVLPEDQLCLRQALAKTWKKEPASLEARLRKFDNSYLWCRLDLYLSFDAYGVPVRLVGFISDIDDIKKQSELLATKVQTDPMTGLYNKVAFSAYVEQLLKGFPLERHALIILDIDNFKGINDTYGHTFGDIILIEACTKLRYLFPEQDFLGRMGGDEFAIFMRNIPSTDSVLKKATELNATFRQTYTNEKKSYHISCSMGIFLVENNHDDFATLFHKADAALYQAKAQGKNQFVLYQEQYAKNYPLQTSRSENEKLQNLKTTRSIEAQIFELLYSAKDFALGVNLALATIGQYYHLCRIAIFKNSPDNLTATNTYEWCSTGVCPNLTRLQDVKLTSGNEAFLDSFNQNGLLACSDVRELSPYCRQLLETYHVLSCLQIAMMSAGKINGFISFSECRNTREWTLEETEKLTLLTQIISMFLSKKS
ncbi:MAG: diguanylate cyclase, partial [Acidaminococcaceae bacterium]